MIKPEKAVRDNTVYIAAVSAILSVLMQAVFLILERWDVTVIFGNLLGLATAIANFYLLGLTVQVAVTKEEKDAKTFMKLSMTLRTFGILVIMMIGIVLDRLLNVFDPFAMLIPLLFPRVAIALYPVLRRKEGNDS